MWEVTKDSISEVGDVSRVGFAGEVINMGIPWMPEWVDLPNKGDKIDFRLKDDDGELYYSGWLHDDGECLNQQAALSWGISDAGCTTIEVKRNGKWVQELG